MTTTTDLLSSGSNVTTNGLNAASNSKTSANAAQTQLSSDVNFFLKMLTTQLKNQDPTAPLDTNQFTQQIAQYSGVQQQVVTNANLEKLLAANKQSAVTTAVSYIGKEVETAGNTGEVLGGQGGFSYILPRAAATAEITIKNSSGQQVFKGQGLLKEGRNLVVWDAINSTTGQQEPDGIYTISVKATDSAGKDITAETRAVAIVSGVETNTTGEPTLTAGTSKVAFDKILAVRTPTRAQLAS
jgi:flagellar basal-body rod modification protein FlgD